MYIIYIYTELWAVGLAVPNDFIRSGTVQAQPGTAANGESLPVAREVIQVYCIG